MEKLIPTCRPKEIQFSRRVPRAIPPSRVRQRPRTANFQRRNLKRPSSAPQKKDVFGGGALDIKVMMEEKTIAAVRLKQQELEKKEATMQRKMRKHERQLELHLQELTVTLTKQILEKRTYLAHLRESDRLSQMASSDLASLRQLIEREAVDDEKVRDQVEIMIRRNELQETLANLRIQINKLKGERKGLCKMEQDHKALLAIIKDLECQEKNLGNDFYSRDERLRSFWKLRTALSRKGLSFSSSEENPKKDCENHDTIDERKCPLENQSEEENLICKDKVKSTDREENADSPSFGEEGSAVWREEMGSVVTKLMNELCISMNAYFNVKELAKCENCSLAVETSFVQKNTGKRMCCDCIRLTNSKHEFFEDSSFMSISTRLAMNAPFESSVDAVLKVFKDDISCIHGCTIAQLRTRFGVYASILHLQPATRISSKLDSSSKDSDRAKATATRIAHIWREKTKRRNSNSPC